MRSVDEIIGEAREILSRKGVNLSILEGGTERGLTILRNREVLDSIGIKMRVIGDIEPSLSSKFLGRKISMPVMPAPLSGLVKSVDARCFHRIIKESWDAGVVPWIGYPIQDDVESFEQPFVWIIKPMKDRDKIYQEIERAEKSKALAVGIDIDSAAGIKVGKSVIAYGGMKALSKKELEDIASTTKLPFIVKGVLSEKDYYDASSFSDAVVISNHGGRVIDSAVSPLEILANVEKVVETGVDSGFRYGSDVLKALALNADFVLIGRPVVYALAFENGLKEILEVIGEELKRIMVLTGFKEVGEINREAVIF
ncbi:L-lactate dehydrogenase (FMN-dependent)-related alpha-hydroxy acid dehydrogenase [Archaeoglobus sulfaticallidus PM70-1]|uniref:L-lactate dehydrogenase (FMN-dependent)-related alpha-hydroxy acid dehydrogenase n=1 Tax=Archaeoglobus sulfaticallidus PM70-1 TaxID=387631 RepID=N0BJJ9_9EURY|nr:alpha-hydroxy acid oxidase [Archaeoglobus sulfaticallidus]AGK60656.1 L-lactate dehydrogenase (FMN-dependent)-related alpha-hydroxy acid dehydrogenase [Archaeoglobus sulfaticallidus PM70-1]